MKIFLGSWIWNPITDSHHCDVASHSQSVLLSSVILAWQTSEKSVQPINSVRKIDYLLWKSRRTMRIFYIYDIYVGTAKPIHCCGER